MPTNVVKTKKQEKAWRQAKKIVEEEYGLSKGKKFYKIVMSIYKQLIKKPKKK